MKRFCFAILVYCVAGPVFADAPSTSLRPELRGGGQPAIVVTQSPKKQGLSLRKIFGLERSNRPSQRPAGLQKHAAARIAKGAQGSVCGDSSIKGKAIAPIRGAGACGVANPVRVTSVDGVTLTQAPTIDCNTAKALKSWVRNGVKPAVGNLGGGAKSLRVVAHYACRTRNNRKGAKLSEHAKGRAVDIAAITLQNGQQITVLKGWRSKQQGPILKKMHRAACGPFGTVLGPNADRFHQDHFHFDTARYRSGSYCR